jgi:hypothetical protein
MRQNPDLRRSGVGRIDIGADGFKGIADVATGNDGMNTLTGFGTFSASALPTFSDPEPRLSLGMRRGRRWCRKFNKPVENA